MIDYFKSGDFFRHLSMFCLGSSIASLFLNDFIYSLIAFVISGLSILLSYFIWRKRK